LLPLPQDVDTRDIGERKRRRPSDGYARGMTNSKAYFVDRFLSQTLRSRALARRLE
jgi:hypothetical protein